MSLSLRAFMLGIAAAILLFLPAQAAVFTTTLAGTNEVPPNASTASGTAVVTLAGSLLTVDVDFTGLSASATAAHIHCCTLPGTNAGVAVGLVGFPAVTSGSYSHVFNLLDPSIYSAAFLGAGTAAMAEAHLVAAMFAGTTYVNIHTSVFPGGEIRGQLPALPEPMAWALLGLGLLGIGVVRRRKIAERKADCRAE